MQFSVNLSLLCPNVLLSTTFSDTLNLFYTFQGRNQIWQPYKTDKILILYI
jgi:hypothetical protein